MDPIHPLGAKSIQPNILLMVLGCFLLSFALPACLPNDGGRMGFGVVMFLSSLLGAILSVVAIVAAVFSPEESLPTLSDLPAILVFMSGWGNLLFLISLNSARRGKTSRAKILASVAMVIGCLASWSFFYCESLNKKPPTALPGAYLWFATLVGWSIYLWMRQNGAVANDVERREEPSHGYRHSDNPYAPPTA